MRPASLFVVVVYALVLFGGISEVNGGFLKDLLKFGKKGVDQAGEAIEEAESSSKPLLHDFRAHDSAVLRNQLRPATESEAQRLATMYPYQEEAFSLPQQQLWSSMERQRETLEKLVKAYHYHQIGLRDSSELVRFSAREEMKVFVSAFNDAWQDLRNLQREGVFIGSLDDMPQLVPASQSLRKAWEILESDQSSSKKAAPFQDLYRLVAEIETSLSAALGQRRVCKDLFKNLWLTEGHYNGLAYAWTDYEKVSRELRAQTIPLYLEIDKLVGGPKGSRDPLYGFLSNLNFAQLEQSAMTTNVGYESWNKEWSNAYGTVRSIAEQPSLVHSLIPSRRKKI